MVTRKKREKRSGEKTQMKTRTKKNKEKYEKKREDGIDISKKKKKIERENARRGE